MHLGRKKRKQRFIGAMRRAFRRAQTVLEVLPPKGEKPIVNVVVKKSHVSMISAITNQGKVRFMMYQDAMNSKLLIKFMTRLTKDAGRKVFLILDNLRVHHGKNVKQWLGEHKEQIEVFYLPSYSPELNPDE